MNHGYILHDGDNNPIRATATLMHTSPKVSILSGIEVAYSLRRMGYGTRLLRVVLDDADKEGVTLLLSVSSDDSPKALSNVQLQQWYRRHGFYEIEGKSGTGMTMQRLPSE